MFPKDCWHSAEPFCLGELGFQAGQGQRWGERPILDPSKTFTCFHWGMGAGRPCSGGQQDGWLTPRSCVGYDTHRPRMSGGRSWRQNKIKYIKVGEDIKKYLWRTDIYP